jgi:hypothetical protein
VVGPDRLGNPKPHETGCVFVTVSCPLVMFVSGWRIRA